MNFYSLIIIILQLFIALVIGYYLNKKGILNKDVNGRLSNMIVSVTCPALIVASVFSNSQLEKQDAVRLMLFGLILYLVLPLFAKVMVKIFNISVEKRKAGEALVIFANASFMGFSVVGAVYGNNAVFLASILHLFFNLFMFTYGIYLLSDGAAKNANSKVEWKSIINPGLIACILAMFIFFTSILVPEFISKPVIFIGNLTPVLSMITLGSVLAEYPLKIVFKDKSMYCIALIRLVIIPLTAWWISKIIFKNEQIQGIILITNAMPSATLCAMIANKYGGREKDASVGVVLTTMLSLVTVPLLCLLVSQ